MCLSLASDMRMPQEMHGAYGYDMRMVEERHAACAYVKRITCCISLWLAYHICLAYAYRLCIISHAYAMPMTYL